MKYTVLAVALTVSLLASCASHPSRLNTMETSEFQAVSSDRLYRSLFYKGTRHKAKDELKRRGEINAHDVKGINKWEIGLGMHWEVAKTMKLLKVKSRESKLVDGKTHEIIYFGGWSWDGMYFPKSNYTVEDGIIVGIND